MAEVIATIFTFLLSFATPLFQWLAARANAQVQIKTAEIGAVEQLNTSKEHIIALPGVRWILMAMFAPCVLHLTGIVLGRMHLIAWDMLPLDSVEQTILLSLVVYVPASHLVSR